MKVSGIGRVIFWGGGNLWIGMAVDAIELHAHHAIQVAIGFDGPVQFRPNSGAVWTEYHKEALVRPGALHEFRAPGQRIVNILFEPETPLGRALLERHGGAPIVPLSEEVSDLSAAFDRGADDEVLAQLSIALIARMAGKRQPRKTTDRRILETINWISDHIDRPLSLADAAAVAGLSEGRFRHLFVEETGVAFRPYVLWTPQPGTGDGVRRQFLDRGSTRHQFRRLGAPDTHLQAHVWTGAHFNAHRGGRRTAPHNCITAATFKRCDGNLG